MAITRLGGANAISGTIPAANVATLTSSNLPTGSVLQVLSFFDQAHRSSTGSYVTAISGSITPSSTSNKVLVSVNGNFSCTTDTYGGTRLLRDATVIGSSTGTSGGTNANQYFQAINHRDGDAQWEAELVSGSFLDSPSSSSAITYYFQFVKHYGSTITQNRPYSTNDAAYHWNTPTTMTLTEIKG